MRCINCEYFEMQNKYCRKWERNLNVNDIEKACEDYTYLDDEDNFDI
jgi:hypothetical protein